MIVVDFAVSLMQLLLYERPDQINCQQKADVEAILLCGLKRLVAVAEFPR